MNRTCIPAILVVAAVALTGCGSSNSSTTSADNTTSSNPARTTTSPTTTTQPAQTTTQPSTRSTRSTGATRPTTTSGKSTPAQTQQAVKAFVAKGNAICSSNAAQLNITVKEVHGPAAIYAKVAESYAALITQMQKLSAPAVDGARFAAFVRALERQGAVYPRLNSAYLAKNTALVEKLEEQGENRARARRAAAKSAGLLECSK